jgi:beta-ureidopropionase / N-carbamoyl-L-amino-acid hydrolase
LVEAVREIVTRLPGRQVGTVGRFEVFPNAPNVIPGLVKLSIEFRDLSGDTVTRLGDEVAARAQEIARQTDTEVSLKKIAHDPAALACRLVRDKSRCRYVSRCLCEFFVI